MSRRRPAAPVVLPSAPRRRAPLMQGLLVAGGAVAFAVWAANRGATPRAAPAAVSTAPADACVSPPAFALRAGLRPPLLVDLRGKPGVKGFSLLEAGPGGKSLRQPDWEAVGSVGSHTLDRHGHIYVAPTPFFRAGGGLAGLSNQFYRVDSATGRAAEFTRLPSDAPPGPGNPFGVTGLAYDCATDSLYAASVAGSGPRGEAGRIFQIDPATRAIRAEWRGVDALGLAVFGDRHGRRLYFGSARRSEIRSLPLDAAGAFAGPPRLEARLAAQTGAAFDKAHALRFYPDGRLEAKGVEFSYSLVVASDPQRNLYTFTRHPTEDRWEFRDTQPQR